MKQVVSIVIFLYYSICFGQSNSCQTYNNSNPFNPSFTGNSTISCGASTSITCSVTNSKWYAQSTGGNPITSNNVLTVSPTSTTSYYVQREVSLNQTATFNHTGNQQTWIVPAGVTSINVVVAGAKGAPGSGTTNNGTAGLGGKVQATISVTPGQILYIYVGGSPSCTSCGGWNGGGLSANVNAGGGGGGSDIRIGGTNLSNRVIVASGGGGGGCFCFCCGSGNGGNGGGLIGSDSNYPFSSTYSSYYGRGGTQSSGGQGGSFSAGSNGSLGQGGTGALYGAGGGGGYYGGGGGAQDMGGGGGSSFATSSATNVIHTPGSNNSNGYITISYAETCASSRVAKTITVNPIAAPLVPTSNSPQCTSVTINSISPPTGVTYYWQGTNANGISTTTNSSNSISISSSGTYYLRSLNSAGCWSAATSISLVVAGLPNSPANPIITNTQCNSATLSRGGTPASGVIWYWQGTNPNGTSTSLGSGTTYTATTTGTYYIRSKFSNYDCWSNNSGSIAVDLTAPSVPNNPSSDSPQCATVLIQQSGTPPNGQIWYWQGTNPNGTSTSSSSSSLSVTSSGTYYLRARNSAGCWSNSSAGIPIIVSGYPATPSVLTSNSPNCSNVTIQHLGNVPSNVSWYWQGTNPSGTSMALGNTPNFVVNTSGTYYLRAFNAPNCWSNNSSYTNITVLNPSSATISVSDCGSYSAPDGTVYSSSGQYQSIIPNLVGCDSTININLTINPVYSIIDTVFACENYTWINGVNYTQTNNSASYILTTSSGCDSTIHLNLFIGQPSVDTTFIQISAIDSYELNGVVYNENGQYYQTIIDSYGCDSTISIELMLEFLNVLEIEKSGIRMFPNPSLNGIFYINGQDLQILELSDILGNKIDYTFINQTLNLGNFSKGTYFLHIKKKEQLVILKLIYV